MENILNYVYCKIMFLSNEETKVGIMYPINDNYTFDDMLGWVHRNCTGCNRIDYIDDKSVIAIFDTRIEEYSMDKKYLDSKNSIIKIYNSVINELDFPRRYLKKKKIQKFLNDYIIRKYSGNYVQNRDGFTVQETNIKDNHVIKTNILDLT